MGPLTLIAGYCLLIVAASLLGGKLPVLVHLSHRRMQLVLSLVGGLMLSISMFVLFTHSLHELGSVEEAVSWTLVGMLAMFFLIRGFHFHQHDFPASDPSGEVHECSDHHEHAHHGHSTNRRRGSLAFLGIGFGLGVHTLIDGIALAAAVSAASSENAATSMAGLGTFLAIALHKPLDALSITSVMAADGWSVRAQSLANLLFASMCPIGAGIFLLSLDRFYGSQQAILGGALAFSAGAFLSIALSDLLPEIQFHSHDRLRLSAMLLVGVGLGYAVSRLESHEHQPAPSPHKEHSPDEHGDDHGNDGHHGHKH